jgi:methyl-accepting chemotaxis protein
VAGAGWLGTLARLPVLPQVLAIIFLVALIPLGMLVYSTNVRLRAAVQEKVELELRMTAQALAGQIDAWTDLNLRVLRQHASLPDIVSLDTERQLPALVSIERAYEWTYRVVALDAEGWGTARSSGEPIFDADGSPTFFRGDRDYFLEVMAGAPVGQQVLISRSTGKPALCLSVPIAPGDRVRGVLFECAFLDVLSSAITDSRIGETGFAVLLNDEGKVIAHGGDPTLVRDELQDFGEHPTLLDQGRQVVYEDAGRRVLGYARDAGLGWTLVLQQDVAEAFAPLIAARRTTLALIVVTLLLTVVTAIAFARRLVRPISRLSSIADSISRGDLGVSISETSRSDEIGALARSIERLQVSVHLMLEELQGGRGGGRR